MSDQPHLAKGAIGQFGGRVGHKAAGFISKKFFHPSNYKNQEKLWAAIEAKKEQEQRQEELQKKREEERRVESLIKQMKGAQPSSSSKSVKRDLTSLADETSSIGRHEKEASEETRKRLMLLHRMNSAPGTNMSQPSLKMSIKSSFAEDLHERGHSEVWGSYFDLESKKWGYACCKTLDRMVACPAASSSPKRPTLSPSDR